MSVAYFPCIQYVKVTSRSHGLFSVGNYGRSNNNKRCCLVVVSTKKMNDVHLELKAFVPSFEAFLACIGVFSPPLLVQLSLLKQILFIPKKRGDEKGLAVAIAQNVDTGAILMQGFANRDALATTISSCKATFYSQSRSTLWMKGESSKNFMNVHDIFLDCDHDSTGGNKLALTILYSLESTISEREAELAVPRDGKPSWTKQLLHEKLLGSKIREEADVLYHATVLLALKKVKTEDVLQVL